MQLPIGLNLLSEQLEPNVSTLRKTNRPEQLQVIVEWNLMAIRYQQMVDYCNVK